MDIHKSWKVFLVIPALTSIISIFSWVPLQISSVPPFYPEKYYSICRRWQPYKANDYVQMYLDNILSSSQLNIITISQYPFHTTNILLMQLVYSWTFNIIQYTHCIWVNQSLSIKSSITKYLNLNSLSMLYYAGLAEGSTQHFPTAIMMVTSEMSWS